MALLASERQELNENMTPAQTNSDKKEEQVDRKVVITEPFSVPMSPEKLF